MNIRLTILSLLAVLAAFLGMLTSAEAQSNYEPYSFATFAGFPPGSADGTGSDAGTVGVASVSSKGVPL